MPNRDGTASFLASCVVVVLVACLCVLAIAGTVRLMDGILN